VLGHLKSCREVPELLGDNLQYKLLMVPGPRYLRASVADPDPNPDPPDPHVFGPSGSTSQRGMDPDPDPALDLDPYIIVQK
jgi:hypothetical protein